MKLWAALEYAEEHPDANIQRGNNEVN